MCAANALFSHPICGALVAIVCNRWAPTRVDASRLCRPDLAVCYGSFLPVWPDEILKGFLEWFTALNAFLVRSSFCWSCS